MDGQTLANIGQTLGIVGASALTGLLGYAKAGGFGKERQAQTKAKGDDKAVCFAHSGVTKKIDVMATKMDTMHEDIKELARTLQAYQVQIMGYIVAQAEKTGKINGKINSIFMTEDTDVIPLVGRTTK